MGLMPNPEEGCQDLKRIFIDHIYLNSKIDVQEAWRYTAAISGAHTIGKMNEENSGYSGHWSRSPGTFNNDYYVAMAAQGWAPTRNIGGNPDKNAWKLADAGRTWES